MDVTKKKKKTKQQSLWNDVAGIMSSVELMIVFINFDIVIVWTKNSICLIEPDDSKKAK